MRQTAFETKEGQRFKISGNLMSGGWCNLSVLAGTPTEFGSLNSDTNLFPVTSTTCDIEYAYNKTDTTCGDAMQIVGYNTPAYSARPTQRVWIHDNVIYNVDRIRNSSWTSPPAPGFSGNGDGIRFADGPQKIVFTHNTMDYLAGLFPDAVVVQCHPTEGAYFASNFLGFSNDNNGGGATAYGCGAPNSPLSTYITNAGDAITKTWNNYTWSGNWLLGGYSDSMLQTSLTNAQLTSIASSWSGLPGTGFINPAACNSITCRHANIGWLRPSSDAPYTTPWHPTNYLMATGSSYLAGGTNHGTDGKDIGANIQQMIIEQGNVSSLHFIPPATVAFIAPTTTTCTVDWSADSFSTFHRFTPTNSPANRTQSVALTGFPGSGTPLQARTNCTGVNQIISFTVP